MNDKDVERVMMLVSCSEEEARRALSETDDVIDAADMLMSVPATRGAPKQKTLTEEQSAFTEIRKNMEAIDKLVQTNLTKSNQPDSSYQGLKDTHVQEEMTLHSDCIQSSQIPTQEEEEQKQGTACQ
jgi:hypothetical protein